MRLTCVLGAQKKRLIEMVLLSTQNICFDSEIIKLFIITTFIRWFVSTFRVNSVISFLQKHISQFFIIQGSYRQVCVRFKNFQGLVRFSYCFQGLKTYEKY